MRPIAVIISLALLATGSSLAPSAGGTPQDSSLADVNAFGREITNRIRAAKTDGNLLTVMQALRALETEYATKEPIARQVLSLFSMERTVELGNYAEALQIADRDERPAPRVESSMRERVDALEVRGALGAIADLVENELIVLINEAHHVPQHRAFSIELLHELRPLGFTHFAAETLYATDVDLQTREYPTEQSGAYLNEPVYADLVRTAIALGYQVVPYESFGRDRELGQATNIIERILDVDPDARVVVHAGYSHINEQGMLAGSRTMGSRLKEITGIDPITIDQTEMSERSSPEFEHSIYRHVVDGRSLTEPSVLINADGAPWTLQPGVRDVTLFHPRSVYEHGRPTWLQLGGRRRAYALPANICDDAPRCLVRARALKEGEDAVPIDRVEVVAGAPVPALLLPAGEFVLEALTEDNTLLSSERIQVQ